MLRIVKKWQLYTLCLIGLLSVTAAEARTVYKFTYSAHGPGQHVHMRYRVSARRCHRCHRVYYRAHYRCRSRFWSWFFNPFMRAQFGCGFSFGFGFGGGCGQPYQQPINYGGQSQPTTPHQDGLQHQGGGTTPIDATRAQKALIEAVRAVGGKSVDGQFDPNICRLTEEYAQQMAQKNGIDGHAGFNQRANSLMQMYGSSPSEIIAENQGYGSVEEAARQCVASWYQSPGHYEHMMPYQSRYCYSMAQSASGKYLCVGLFSK